MSESKGSPILTRVIATVLSAGALWALAKIPGLVHWVADTCVSFWGHLKGTTAIPNWALYVFAIVASHSSVVLIKRFAKPRGPRVTEYTQDSFLGLTWRWSYTYSGHPSGPWAFCPQCDTQLVYGHDYSGLNQTTVLTCETCGYPVLNHDGDKDYLVAKILRQIDRKTRNGEWIPIVQLQRTQQAAASDARNART